MKVSAIWSMEICPERQKVKFWAKSILAQYTGRYFRKRRQISLTLSTFNNFVTCDPINLNDVLYEYAKYPIFSNFAETDCKVDM